MTQSMFGSLEEDLREEMLQSTYESSPEGEERSASAVYRDFEGKRERTSSLSGYYEAMGRELTNTSLDPPTSQTEQVCNGVSCLHGEMFEPFLW